MGTLLKPINYTGRLSLSYLRDLGALALFLFHSLRLMIEWPFALRKVVNQAYIIGVNSLPVVLLIGLFTGMVLGLQGYYSLAQFGSEGLLGGAVALTLIRELGPVLTALMVVGQAGSAMAAEMADMRNSEQIDALSSMAINPLRFLVGPRLLAALITFPLLTAIFNAVGLMGAYLTAVKMLDLDASTYWSRVEASVTAVDLSVCYWKTLFFSLLTTGICCYQGFFVHTFKDGHGSRGISIATTRAVVFSSIIILIADYVITSFFI